MNEATSFSIKIIRITATLMIFLCHTVFLFGNTIGLTAQFFNIGVDIFIIISSYLFSSRGSLNSSPYRWYKKRLLRIFIPYYIYLIFVFIAYAFTNTNIAFTTILESIFLLNGITEDYLPGAAHLWFLTFLLICYFLTPLLYKIKKWCLKYKITFSLFLTIIYILLALFSKDIIGTIYINVLEYIIIFLITDKLFEFINTSNSSSKKILFGIFSVIASCGFKLVFNILFDGTILYSKFLVPFIDTTIGISIFISIFLISKYYYQETKDRHIFTGLVNHLDSISFEFYLVHYFFITGPISVMNISNPLIVCLLILLVSYLSANILHLFCNLFFKVIKK